MKITAAQRKAYQKTIKSIVKKANSLDQTAYDKMVLLLADFQRKLAVEIRESATPGTNIMTVQQMNAIKHFVNTETPNLQRALNASLNGVQVEVWDLGREMANKSLASMGILVGPVPSFSPEQFMVATSVSADLITNLTQDMRVKINTQIAAGVLGQKNPYDVIKEVDSVLGLTAAGKDAGVGVTYKAERIVRTEINRTFNIASRAQTERLNKEFKGALRHYWQAADDLRTREEHLKAGEKYDPKWGGKPIPVDQPFIVGGEELMYPGDPAGSAWNTINCRCREIIEIDDEAAVKILEAPGMPMQESSIVDNLLSENIVYYRSLYKRINLL